MLFPFRVITHAVTSLLLAAAAVAQEVIPTEGLDWPVLGQVKTRPASEIESSWWSVGGETLDRDFATYRHYAPYVGPLGATQIRLQGGWAKTEKVPGQYDFAWLDEVVDHALSQGVHPWIEFSYGNPAYPGGGDAGLGGGFPRSPEALAAWDAWVRATVLRYRDRVYAWEVWNEPDLNTKGTAPVSEYIPLYIRTAEIVRELQPDSTLYALALADHLDYADAFLQGLQAKGRLDLVDAITVHAYPNNPDWTGNIDGLRAIVAKTGADIQIRQGETGATSRYQDNFALKRIDFTETMQAKWNLRRMLAHRAKDVPFNLFTMSDLHYNWGPGRFEMNYKGLLATNPDQTIHHVKPAYYAAQHVFTLFDDSLTRVADFPATTATLRDPAISAYRYPDKGWVVAYWYADAPPDHGSQVTWARAEFPRADFSSPVVVDLRTGLVYEVPADAWEKGETGTRFLRLPFYDSPMLIAERDAIPLRPRQD